MEGGSLWIFLVMHKEDGRPAGWRGGSVRKFPFVRVGAADGGVEALTGDDHGQYSQRHPGRNTLLYLREN